jgi:hypothetical protein
LEAKGDLASRVLFSMWFAGALLLSATGVEAATFTINTTDDTSDAELSTAAAPT